MSNAPQLGEDGRHLRDGPVILLQGPTSGLFGALAVHLRRVFGRDVIKVQFNAADATIDHTAHDIVFKGPPEALADWYANLFGAAEPCAIVLYEDLRPQHALAMAVAQHYDIPVVILTEGYIQPDYVTLEVGGAHQHSSLRRRPIPLATLAQDEQSKAYRLRLLTTAGRASIYLARRKLGQGKFAALDDPRQRSLRKEAISSGKSLIGMFSHRRHDVAASLELAAAYAGHYFVVALQGADDLQLIAAGHDWTTEALIAETIASFASHAATDDVLVFKQSAMDVGRADWLPLITQHAIAAGVDQRVFYLRFARHEVLLQASRGLITINSAVGLVALHQGCPVFCLADAVYVRQGLAIKGDVDDLAAFWNAPARVDMAFYERFRNFMIANTQVNANVHVRKSWPLILAAVSHRLSELITPQPDLTRPPEDDSVSEY